MSQEIRHLADLKPDSGNARKHTPRNVGTIVDALHEVGAARSIVIDEHGTILAGNATAEAAAEAGIERVQVVDADGSTLVAVRRTGLTPQQKRRLALFDNRAAELAEWDAERLAAFLAEDAAALEGLFHREEVDALLATLRPPAGADPGPQIDRAEELRAKWATAPGQLWAIGPHRLLCGDATSAADVARLLDGAAPRLLVTDPPYGVDYDPRWRDAAQAIRLGRGRAPIPSGDDAPHDWTAALAVACVEVAYCWAPPGAQQYLTQRMLEGAGYEVRQQIVWVKPMAPLSRSAYHWRHEPCWYAVRAGKQAGWIGDRAQTTVWEMPSPTHLMSGSDEEATPHATQKPVECYATPLRNHAGDLYDPFVGSGTAVVAAEQAGRRCYALEIDPAYVAVALERLAGMGLAPRLAD
jgi:DNA modification methylase